MGNLPRSTLIDQDRSYGRSKGGSWGDSYDDYRSVLAMPDTSGL